MIVAASGACRSSQNLLYAVLKTSRFDLDIYSVSPRCVNIRANQTTEFGTMLRVRFN
jgi:hypothetical protein